MLSPAELYNLLSILTKYDSRNKLGTITLENDETLKNFMVAISDTENTGWDYYGNKPLVLGTTLELEVQPPKSSIYGKFYISVEDFLLDKSNLFKKPRLFYVHEIRYHPYTTTKNTVINSYESILEFNKILSSICAYSDNIQASWFILHGSESIHISPIINIHDLKKIDEKSINKLNSFFLDNIHHKQKCSIFSKIIVQMVCEIPFEDRYKIIVENIDKIYERLNNDYSVFAAEFSYEKIINQIENEKLEEQVKIHKVITDIQAQILGIPVATVIIATQYKIDPNQPSSFWINLSILFGAFIFTLLMTFSAENQKNTLTSIELELIRKQKLLDTKFPQLANTKPYQKLEKRIKYQNYILKAIQFIVIIGFLIACIFFYKIS
ncbi:hypothetical protein [Acinetobacter sp. UBA3106]|uniref:hypothetical protein n=1 Tax=Acinetobacter sp. UBA3106 TaxID=1945936 RepID=UPI0025BAA3D6|nr:hypothetical protein [Acinetobacter sp. UBA3106]